MRVVQVQDLDDTSGLTRGGVATLGVFDGVHLGHQRILSRLIDRSREEQVASIVLTFAVHPVTVLRGLPARLITSLPHRLRLFEKLGVSECVVLPFDDSVRCLEAVEFSRRIFQQALALKGLVLGRDARIGCDGKGNLEFLDQFCRANRIWLEVIEDLRVDDVRVSSTRIRAAIADGDLVRAARMLGREWSMLGTVIRGDERGRKLGFRTANLDLRHEIRPPPGVYAGTVRKNGDQHACVVNVGIRPTFGPDGDLTVEAHLLDFDSDLYGAELELTLLHRVRAEKRFENREALIRQITADIAEARRFLADKGPFFGSGLPRRP
ncbi:MAG: riboflavin biosynthesis protein RibF [Planctomycetota bacterium]